MIFFRMVSHAHHDIHSDRGQSCYDLPLAEPNHERALRNLDYFNGLRTENEAVFVDAEIISSNEENIEDERSVYEAACREGKPLVSTLIGIGKRGMEGEETTCCNNIYVLSVWLITHVCCYYTVNIYF